MLKVYLKTAKELTVAPSQRAGLWFFIISSLHTILANVTQSFPSACGRVEGVTVLCILLCMFLYFFFQREDLTA